MTVFLLLMTIIQVIAEFVQREYGSRFVDAAPAWVELQKKLSFDLAYTFKSNTWLLRHVRKIVTIPNFDSSIYFISNNNCLTQHV